MFNCSLGDFMKKDFMKIKANSDGNLPLNKRLKLYNMTYLLDLLLKIIANVIHKFFLVNVCMSYKDATQYEKNQI